MLNFNMIRIDSIGRIEHKMEKKVTISDVAKYVGVSKSTVSQYINGNHQKCQLIRVKRLKRQLKS